MYHILACCILSAHIYIYIKYIHIVEYINIYYSKLMKAFRIKRTIVELNIYIWNKRLEALEEYESIVKKKKERRDFSPVLLE